MCKLFLYFAVDNAQLLRYLIINTTALEGLTMTIYKTMEQAKAALAAYEARTGKQAIIHIVGPNQGYKLIAWGA